MLKFSSTCTLPPDIVNFVSSPNTRGTWDIFWASLTTLFLCTWSVQHPNLPGQKSSHGLKARLAELPKRLALMLMTLIAPEFLLMKAIGDLSAAKALSEEIGWRAERDHAEWSIEHSYLLNMGGILISFTDETPESPQLVAPSIIPSQPSLHSTVAGQGTTTIAEESIETAGQGEVMEPMSVLSLQSTTALPKLAASTSGGLVLEKAVATTASTHNTVTKADRKAKVVETLTPHQKNLLRLVLLRERRLPACDDRNTLLIRDALVAMKSKISSGEYNNRTFININYMAINLVRLRESTWALDGAQFIRARELGLVASIPNITKDEIEDKSNSDFIVKFLACVQVGWEILQLLIRWGKHIPASQLEIVTVAYSFLTFFVYTMNWKKPQDVQTPWTISALRYATVEELITLADIGPQYVSGAFTGFRYTMPEHALHSNFKGLDGWNTSGGILSWIGAIAGGLLFGLFHCAAWSFNFPTPIERLLWRIASVITGAIPVAFGFRTALIPLVESAKNRQRWPVIEDNLLPTAGMCVVAVYTFSRCVLLVETFRSLFYLVPDTFLS